MVIASVVEELSAAVICRQIVAMVGGVGEPWGNLI
jgi:hypothetical protein